MFSKLGSQTTQDQTHEGYGAGTAIPSQRRDLVAYPSTSPTVHHSSECRANGRPSGATSTLLGSVTGGTASCVVGKGSALDNGLARTPPMGWMAWATFLCETNCDVRPDRCISENLFRQMADRLVEDGFLEVGYNRIHIDDCWMEKRRNMDGELEADSKRFPHGIKGLAKYMHDRNLELGIYADFGTATCMGYPGSSDRLEQDAKTFASWDADYLKMDGCHSWEDKMKDGYALMERSLNATGRPIIFSCSYPYYLIDKGLKVDWTAVAQSCNLWRFYTDVEGSWQSISSIIRFVDDHQDMLGSTQKPGAWNDMDMIVAGLGSLTPEQAKVQMTLWSMWSSPLIMSNDLRTLTAEYRKILQNRDVIAIDQDPLGVMGKLVRKDGSVGIYVKPVTPVINGLTSFALAVVNMDQSNSEEVRFTYESLGLVNIDGYKLRNLWSGEDLGMVFPTQELHVVLPPTSASMFKLTLLF
ncbi:Alpha-galactosidase [Trichostrongylus colubriformis]|uniref:Alpha-galactosidase n=1 Tax=Trichostrongylus colubriformis TaxID=6319 RepID=A0AAN8IZE6_TRICO